MHLQLEFITHLFRSHMLNKLMHVLNQNVYFILWVFVKNFIVSDLFLPFYCWYNSSVYQVIAT